VQGTRHADGTVSAQSIAIGTGAPGGRVRGSRPPASAPAA
jgi:hypothetical protein